MGYLGLFIHSGFGDGSGLAKRFTTQEIHIQIIVAHLAHMNSLSGHLRCTIFIQSGDTYTTSVTHLSSDICAIYLPSVCLILYANLCIFIPIMQFILDIHL